MIFLLLNINQQLVSEQQTATKAASTMDETKVQSASDSTVKSERVAVEVRSAPDNPNKRQVIEILDEDPSPPKRRAIRHGDQAHTISEHKMREREESVLNREVKVAAREENVNNLKGTILDQKVALAEEKAAFAEWKAEQEAELAKKKVEQEEALDKSTKEKEAELLVREQRITARENASTEKEATLNLQEAKLKAKEGLEGARVVARADNIVADSPSLMNTLMDAKRVIDEVVDYNSDPAATSEFVSSHHAQRELVKVLHRLDAMFKVENDTMPKLDYRKAIHKLMRKGICAVKNPSDGIKNLNDKGHMFIPVQHADVESLLSDGCEKWREYVSDKSCETRKFGKEVVIDDLDRQRLDACIELTEWRCQGTKKAMKGYVAQSRRMPDYEGKIFLRY